MTRAKRSAAQRIGVAVGAIGIASLGGCKEASAPGPSASPGTALGAITVTSKSLPSDAQIPVDYTCDGKDVAPALTWSAPPEGTKSIAVMVDDRDAPAGHFTHWLVFNLPPDTLVLAEATDPAALGARVGQNDFQGVRYNGPCPPRRELHRYKYWVYAVDEVLPLADGATRASFDAAVKGHLLAAGALEATFAH